MTLPMPQVSAQTNTEHITVTFCASEDDVYPFFVTENSELSGINIRMLKQIFDDKRIPNTSLQVVRRPWKRCNIDLQNGSVDLMIAGYLAERKDVVYPSGLGLPLRENAISTADICFLSLEGLQLEKTNKGMTEGTEFVVGIPAGFSKQVQNNIRPKWVELFNPAEKYKMLEMGRVDAIVEVCALGKGYPIKTVAETEGYDSFITVYPPYLSNPAYIVFSEKFAMSHRGLAKQIIVESQNVNKQTAFAPYLLN
jgi:hypothetical protein